MLPIRFLNLDDVHIAPDLIVEASDVHRFVFILLVRFNILLHFKKQVKGLSNE